MSLDNLSDLFRHELSAMYDGEERIAELLKDAAQRIDDKQLKGMLNAHEKETEEQIRNLDRCFGMLEMDRQKNVTCAGIQGLRKEYDEVVKQKPSREVLAMFVLGGAMKIEHYEIAAYRGLVNKAMLMGEAECAQALQTNLVQEEETAGKVERAAHEMGLQLLAPA